MKKYKQKENNEYYTYDSRLSFTNSTTFRIILFTIIVLIVVIAIVNKIFELDL